MRITRHFVVHAGYDAWVGRDQGAPIAGSLNRLDDQSDDLLGINQHTVHVFGPRAHVEAVYMNIKS